jgi:hypothetical protein
MKILKYIISIIVVLTVPIWIIPFLVCVSFWAAVENFYKLFWE